MRAVEPLGLIGRGQAEEHDNRVRPSREGDRLVGQRLVLVLGVDPEAGSEGQLHAVGDRDTQFVERDVDADRVDLGTAGTLVPRRANSPITGHQAGASWA